MSRRGQRGWYPLGQVWLGLGAVVLAHCSDPSPSSDGGPDGGDGGGGFDAGGDGAIEVPMVGDPCTSDLECILQSNHGRVACLQSSWGFRGGYCTVVGTNSIAQCRQADPESTWMALPCATPVCVSRCETSADCRQGYECFQSLQACWPRCEPGRACPVPPPNLCEGDEQCDDGDPCTTDGCVNGICAYDRVTERPQRAVRFATRGVAEDVQFSGSLSDDSLQLTVAEGEDGVEVFDLSNPTVPKRYLQIATAGPARAVRRGNNRILVAEHEAGLEIFDSGNGGSMGPPLVVEASGGPASVHGFSQIHRGHVVLFLYRAGMAIMNINAMTYGDICDTRGRAVHGLNFPGENVSLAADSLAGLAVCSWAEGTSYATQTERLDTAGRMMALSRRQDLMMVAEGGAGFGVIDVSSPLMPVRRYDSGPLEGEVTDIHMTGTATVAVAAQDAGVLVFAMEDCFEPVLWYQWPTDGPATSVDEVDGVLAVGLGEAGVDLVDMGCRPPAE